MREPFWTVQKYLVTVWTEDDATGGILGHESLSSALKRLELLNHTVVAEWDAGDAQYKLLTGNFVTCSSYPGNSGIYRLNQAGIELWKIDRMSAYGKLGSSGV